MHKTHAGVDEIYVLTQTIFLENFTTYTKYTDYGVSHDEKKRRTLGFKTYTRYFKTFKNLF